MRREILEQALREAVPARHLRELTGRKPGERSGKPLEHRKRSNTTISALKYADGILCIGDRKTSGWGYSIVSQDAVKIYPISGRSVLLGSGAVTSIQLAEQAMANANAEFREDHEFDLTTAGQAHYLAQLMRLWAWWYGDSFCAYTIIAGFDFQKGPRIFEVESDGALVEHAEYAATGSGGIRFEDQLDARWKPGLPEAGALEVALHAMFHSGMRDSGSSPPIIALPTAATITKAGITWIPERTVERALGRVLLTKRGVRRSFALALIRGRE